MSYFRASVDCDDNDSDVKDDNDFDDSENSADDNMNN